MNGVRNTMKAGETFKTIMEKTLFDEVVAMVICHISNLKKI